VIPPKKYLWNKDPEFLKQRFRDLKNYLDKFSSLIEVLEHPAF
jgi:hypothetical protein